ncbi:MAG: response regulator [Bacteroidetes bacterium]|nr:response regulator [Bacteroidota bacterium]
MDPRTAYPGPTSVVSHIMIVDDEDDYHLITRMMLKKAGFQGRLTAYLDPGKAMEHLRNGSDPPDLLFVDINMPATDGFAFLEQCLDRTLIQPGRTTVVMCSSSNRPIDMEKAHEVDCVSEYIEKPLTTDQFLRIAAEHSKRAHTPPKA